MLGVMGAPKKLTPHRTRVLRIPVTFDEGEEVDAFVAKEIEARRFPSFAEWARSLLFSAVRGAPKPRGRRTKG